MNKKIKVLHVLKSSIYSGAENVAITIINHLDKNYESAYLATNGEIEAILKKNEISYFLLNKYTRNNISKVIKNYQPDIVHAHDFSATVFCATIPGSFHLISHIHYDPPWVQYWNLRTITYNYFNKRIDKVLTVSTSMFKNMVFADKFIDKVSVVKNPIDIENIKQKANIELPSDKSMIDIIYVGRFVEQKDPQRFIRIIQELKNKGLSKLNCVMLGDGELLGECKKIVHESRLDDTIQFLGFQQNPYTFMKNSKLLCITSRWEGYGLVIAEANILEIPVLSTKTSGACEILGDESWEMCENDIEFVEKALRLFTDQLQYKIIKEAAIKRAENFVNVEDYISTISSIYKNEVDNP